jgi:hypothetical protein
MAMKAITPEFRTEENALDGWLVAVYIGPDIRTHQSGYTSPKNEYQS